MWFFYDFSSLFSSLTIISRVVRHPDSRWKLSETGEELAGRRHFMGQIRHLRGVRRSTKRLRLSPADGRACLSSLYGGIDILLAILLAF